MKKIKNHYQLFNFQNFPFELLLLISQLSNLKFYPHSLKPVRNQEFSVCMFQT